MTLTQILSKLKSLVYSKTETDTLLGNKAASSHTHTKSQITDFPSLATVATSGSYSDLSNRSLLTVNGATSLGWSGIGGVANGSTLQLCTTDNTSPSICFHRAGYSHVVLAEAGGVLGIQAQGSDWLELATKSWVTSLGYITSSGSCNYANSAEYVQGNNNSANAANALLRSGGGRSDSSPEGDTWIFLDELGGASAPWGFKHNQLVNTIGFYGAGTETSSINLSNGHFSGTVDWSHVVNRPTNVSNFTNDSGYITSSGSCNYANSAGSVAWDNVSGKPSAFTPYFANGTWYAVGDDAAIGDHNVSGGLGVKAINSTTTRIDLCYKDDAANYKSITYDGTTLYMNGNCDYATNANYANSAGSVAWDNVSGRPWAVSQFTNDSGYITTDGAAYPRRVGGVTMNFNWNGQGGQPTWLWGGEDGTNMYVYNPANFSVNYANSAGYTNWLRTSSHADHIFHTEWDGSYFWTYVAAGDGGYRPVRVERSNSSGWADSAGGVAWGNVSGRPWALSQFTNDSGFLTSHQDLSGYVPRSGGAVMTGNALSSAVNNYELRLDGGTGWAQGASVVLTGKDNTNYTGYIRLIPHNSSAGHTMRLAPDGGWDWDGTPVQYASDQRLKQQISNIDNKLLDAWEDVLPCQFKYNEAVEQKGKDNARLHTGYVVQQIDNACKEHGVDISEYGLYCHEEYPEETEEVEVEQADGTKIKERKVIREASEHYSLRYTETLVVECAFLRREVKRLSERLSKLEQPSTSEK